MTSTIKRPFPMKKVTKSYSNISFGSTNYKYIDSFSGLGIDPNEYDLFSYMIKGWTAGTPAEIVKGSNGTDLYVITSTNSVTISTMTVEYYFIEK